MATLIENWVKSKVGICISLDSPNAVDQLYDGYTFFQILQSYGIKNSDSQSTSERANVSASAALRNLRLLRPLLCSIGISLTDSELMKISQKDRSKCLWLLFELHLRLENKSKVRETAKEKTRNGNREHFTLKRNPPFASRTSPSLKDAIMFQPELYRRRELFNTNSNINNEVLQEPLSFKQMVKFDKESLFYKEVNSMGQHAQRNKMKDAILKLNIGNALMNDMWESFLGGREDYLTKLLNTKLQEQSKYETNMSTNLAGQAIKIQEKFPSTHRWSCKDTIFKDMFLERRRKLDLHNQLYKEKLYRKFESRRKLCQETVSDMIDLAILISEFHSDNGIPPTRFVMNDWKELFFQGIPFFLLSKTKSTLQEESESVLECQSASEIFEDVRTIDTQIILDRFVCERLIKFYVHSYLYLVGNWKIEYWPELGSGNENLNIQGYLVHRLLECKYPLPNPPKRIDVDNLKVRSVLKNFSEPAFLQNLELLLKKPNIKLIKYSNAVRYCIDVYEYEKSIVSIGLMETAGTQIKKKTKQVSSKVSVIHDSPVTHANKSVQCPEIAEQHRYMIHSTVGQLGKLATESDLLSDNVLSTKIMVAYIQSLKNYNGFVMVDFPTNESQAVLLEFLITGHPVEVDTMNYEIDDSVQEFIFNALNPPFTIDTRKLINLESLFSNLLLETTLEVIPTYHDIKKSMKSKMEEMEEEVVEEHVYEESSPEVESNTEMTYAPFNSSSPQTTLSHSDFETSKNGTKHLTEEEPEDDYVGLLEEEIKVDQHKKNISFIELSQLRTSKILPRPNERKVPVQNNRTIITSCIVKFTDVKQYKEPSPLLHDLSTSALEQDERGTTYKKLAFPQNVYQGFDVFIPFIQSDNSFRPTDVARLILNEPIHPNHPLRVPSEELFDSHALVLSKKYKVPKAVPPSASTIDSKSSKDRVDVVKTSARRRSTKHSLSSLNKKPDVLEMKPESNDPASTEILTPGSSGWKYMDESLPEDFQSGLATHWEIVEYVYLESLYQVMYLFHIHNASFFPHRNFIRNLINEDVDHNSCRQQMVSNFQNMFNEVNDIHRRAPAMKMELHCKVHELWNRLCEMADSNKRMLELKLNQIMGKGKFLKYCYTLINIFLSLMQLEIDRYIDTVQIINEYYLKMLCEEPTKSKMEKIQIKKLIIPFDDDVDYEVQSKGNVDLRKNHLDDSVKNLKKLDDRIFLDGIDLDFLITIVKNRISQVAKKSYQCSKAVENMVNDSSVGVTLRRKIKNKLQKKTRARKIIVAPNLQRGLNINDAKTSVFKIITTRRATEFGPQERDLIDTIKWEWSTAICDEEERLHLRTKLIEAKMIYDLNETFQLTKNFYKSFSTDMAARYHQEQQAIDRLCKVLRSAINSECAIRPKLILEKDRFYMGKEESFHTGFYAPPPTPWRMVSEEYRFRMQQMNNFVEKMKYVAPSGLIGTAFIQILEDMLSFTTEKYQPYLPVPWKVLDKDIIEYILSQAFGSVNTLDWRDFVIFNMNIPLPQVDDLCRLKEAYKTFGNEYNENISSTCFKKIPLWFESQDCADETDVQLAKDILFRLYQVNETEMDYGVFLLSFCKGEDNMEGFMKLLMLVDDNGLLINAESHIKRAKKQNETNEVVRQILNILLHETVIRSDDIVIKTLKRSDDECTEEEDNNETVISSFQDEEFLVEEEWNGNIHRVRYISSESSETGPTYPERYCNPMWHVCVPHQLVFKLLSIACIHKLGSDSVLQDLKAKLFHFYRTKGKNGYVEVCELAESEFLKLLFDTISIFTWCDMTYLVESLIRSSFFTTQNNSHGL